MLFRHGDAGNAQEQVKDAGGPDDREPAPRRGEGEDEEGDPDEPFEEIVWVAAVAPEADGADLAFVCGVFLEGGELGVGEGFAAEGEQPEGGAGVFERMEHR